MSPRAPLGEAGFRQATPVAVRLLAAFALCALCLGLFGLFGCAAPSESPAGSEAASSSAAEEPVAPEQDEIAVRMAAPVALQGVLTELADAYAADKEWLSFNVEVYESAKKQNKALTPTEPAVSEGEEEGASGGETLGSEIPSGNVASGASSDAAAEEEPVLLPKADIVFQNSASAMDSAEELGVANPKTRSDMIEDRLVIVASADAPLSSFTEADLQAGSRPLAVMRGKGASAQRQRQALEALGLLEDGAYAGYYGTAPGSVREFDAASDLFASVSADENLVALVRTSDLYRYGGVKVVGTLSPGLYTPLRFPQALGMNLDALENGEQVESAACDFLKWMATDEDALAIIEKWGFFLSA